MQHHIVHKVLETEEQSKENATDLQEGSYYKEKLCQTMQQHGHGINPAAQDIVCSVRYADGTVVPASAVRSPATAPTDTTDVG